MMKNYQPVSRTYSRGNVTKVIHNDKYGYAVVFYEPIYDLDLKIPALKKRDLPHTIPLQSTLKPAGKPQNFVTCVEAPIKNCHETAEEFIKKQIIERKIEEIRDTCANVKYYQKKAENFDLERRKFITPELRRKIRGKSADQICDILVDDVMKNVDYVYDRNLSYLKAKRKSKPKKEEKPDASSYKLAAKYPSEKSKTKTLPKIEVQATVNEEEEEESKEETKVEPKKIVPREPSPELERPSKTHPKNVTDDSLCRHKRRMELARLRQVEAQIFEVKYMTLIRQIKREIRNFETKYIYG